MDVLIDTDPGMGTLGSEPEDSLAVTMALVSPEVTVRAITCVQGNVPVRHSYANATYLLELLGRTHVPLAAGEERPLLGARRREQLRWLAERDAYDRVLPVAQWASGAQAGTGGSVSGKPFVPDDFDPPRELEVPGFHLVPLGAQHNESDHAAWTSSIAHIRATPGFESWGWPPVEGMSLDANRGDLERHARDFAERTGFTFTVLRPGTEEVIGCLYIYPAKGGGDAQVRSWVRADVAELDGPLHAAVSRWLAERWPFERAIYAPRPPE